MQGQRVLPNGRNLSFSLGSRKTAREERRIEVSKELGISYIVGIQQNLRLTIGQKHSIAFQSLYWIWLCLPLPEGTTLDSLDQCSSVVPTEFPVV